jgi:small-conductance mechanosensitive channel
VAGRPAPGHPLHWLAAKLVATLVVAGAVYSLFAVFNHSDAYRATLGELNGTEILLVEAIAITLIAYAVARAVTTAADAVLALRGLSGRGGAVRLLINLLIAVGLVLGLFNLAGVSAESIFLGSAFAGIILGLAAQTVLSNVFAGLLLVFADPFRLGDRISLVSSSYPVVAPSYPHELTYPTYSGTVIDIGLVYTMVRLDTGAEARIPNAVVLSSMLLKPGRITADVHRIRMTFPVALAVATVEGAIVAVQKEFPPPVEGAPQAHLEVADIGASTWDGVIVVWATGIAETTVRDRVMRSVLEQVAPAK